MADEAPQDLDARGPSGASGEVLRLVVVSAVAVLIFAGGVYWLRHQPASLPAHEAGTTTIQVRLVESPDPTPIPLAAADPSDAQALNRDVQQPSPEQAEVTPEEDVVITPSPAVARVRRPPGAAISFSHAAPRQISSDLAAKFQQALQRHIARFQHYPQMAKARGIGGTVKVLFLLRRDGSILDAWVAQTSGETILDYEAVETVRRAEPMPEIPSELPDELRISMPVAFGP